MSKTLYKITTEKYGEWWVIATNSTDAEIRLLGSLRKTYANSAMTAKDGRVTKIEPIAYENTPSNYERLLP